MAGVVAALVLLLMALALYHQALGLWWMEDDFLQVRLSALQGSSGHALDPGAARLLPVRYLTPLLFASYDLDLALFGLDPRAFYAHQLLSLALAAFAVYLLLRGWLPPGWSKLGGVLFLLGPPIASLTPLLMVRHYPESICLGLFSAAAFVAACRRWGAAAWSLATGSAVLYLAASMAKEIALPVPFLLALVPLRSARRRLYLLVPHAAALGVYCVYRLVLVGRVSPGLGWTPGLRDWPGLVLSLPAKVAREVSGPWSWGRAVVAVLLAVILLEALRHRRGTSLLAAGVAAVLLPVLPVAVDFEPRYASAAWLLLVLAFPVAARALRERKMAGGLLPGAFVVWPALALALGGGLAANRAAWKYHLERAVRMSVENRSFLDLGPGDLLRRPLGPPAAMEELRRFSEQLLGRAVRGGFFYDDLTLCRGRVAQGSYRSVWSYDPRQQRLVEITSEIPGRRQRYCSAVRWRAPLTAVFRARGSVLRWTFGPYRHGRWAIVLGEGARRHDLPRRGAFALGSLPRLDLRVRYQDPSGWVTYSSPISLDLGSDVPLHWRRGAEAAGRSR